MASCAQVNWSAGAVMFERAEEKERERERVGEGGMLMRHANEAEVANGRGRM